MAGLALTTTNKDVTGFDPRSIGGCTLWVDAADSASLTLSGSTVTNWRDKSGTGRTYTRTGSVAYDSANKYVYTGTSANVTPTGFFSFNIDARRTIMPFFNVFMVHKWLSSADSSTNQALWGSDNTGGWNRMQLLKWSGYLYAMSYLSTSSGLYYVNSLNTSNTVLYSATLSAGVAAASGAAVNGTFPSALVQETTTTTQNTPQLLYFSSHNGTNYNARIAFYEILVYNASITSRQRQTIEGYLAWKWGLQASLPSTHPFRVTFPRGVFFNPLNVPNCVLWLDGADTDSFVLSGTSVTTWKDKSGSGNDGTSSSGVGGGTAPTYDSTVKGVLFARGTTNSLLSNVSASVQTESIFCVIKSTGSADWNLGVARNIIANNGSGARQYTVRYNEIALITQGAIGIYASGSPSIPPDTVFLVSSVDQGLLSGTTVLANSASGYYNGAFLVTNTGNVSLGKYAAGQTSIIGAQYISPNISGACGSYICELIVFQNIIPTIAQRQQIEGYLANKWGIRSSLDVSQPFRQYLLPQAPLFAPNQLRSTLSAWYDGRDPNNNVESIPLNGATLATWTDKSGNARNGTAVIAPIYSLSNKAVEFSGSPYYTTTLTPAASSETTFIVARKSGGGIVTMLGSDTSSGRRIRVETGNTITFAANAGTQYTTASSIVTTGTTFILTVSYATGDSQPTIRFNGILQTMATSPGTISVSGTSSYIGAGPSGNNAMNGLIMEICVFGNTVLGLTDIQRVEGYLAWKWNLNNLLPATHPYYKIKV